MFFLSWCVVWNFVIIWGFVLCSLLVVLGIELFVWVCVGGFVMIFGFINLIFVVVVNVMLMGRGFLLYKVFVFSV